MSWPFWMAASASSSFAVCGRFCRISTTLPSTRTTNTYQEPFIRQVTSDVERIAQEEQAQAPELSGQPITRQGDTITIGDGDASHEIDITVTDEEWQQIQEALPYIADRSQQVPPYHVGDTVYLDDTTFEITSILHS